MKKPFSVVVALIALCAAAMAMAEGGAVVVNGAYVRAVPPGQPNSLSFMSLTNHSGNDLALVEARSDVAKVVELHTHTMEGGMMRMRKVDKIDVPAGQTAVLEPGGLHVMLIGLKQDLVPGENVEITLVFDSGDEVKVDAPVQKLQMKMKKKEGMQHMH